MHNSKIPSQAPTNVDTTQLLESLSKELSKYLNKKDTDLPPSDKPTSGSQGQELPTLQKPALAAGSNIALDILIDAIGDKVRSTEVKAGQETIKANADQRKAANEKKIAQIEEQIEKLEKAGFWDKLGEVFKYIGMALAAVACVAMVATGVGAGVGVAGLVLLGVSVADSVLDAVGTAVSGRGWGLTSLIGWAVEAATGSEEAGMWTKLGLDIALSIATIVATAGGGGASVAADADKITKVASVVTKVANATQATMGIAGAGTSIASAVYTYQAASAQAMQKEIEAILERITMANELTNKHMQKVLEDTQKTTETVTDIVKENAAVQTAILTDGGGASMA